MKRVLAVILVSAAFAAPAFAQSTPVPPSMMPGSTNNVRPDPAEVSAAISEHIGQLTVQLAQAQAMINAQQREIERLKEVNEAKPAKK